MIDKKLQDEIQQEIHFPSLPAIATQILNMIRNDEAELADLAKVISVDPALTAKMLKVANSSLFGYPSEITTVRRAIAVLGTNTIKSIALSFVLADSLSKKQILLDIDQFWRRSVTAAVAAEMMSKHLKRRDEDIFLMGLLQNLGFLVAIMTKGEEYSTLLLHEKDCQQDLTELEQELYGYDHQQIGAALMKSWNLPDAISMPILFHHKPATAPKEHRKEAEILAVADRLAELYNGDERAEKARLIQEDLVKSFKFKQEETLPFLDEVAEKSREIFTTFELDPEKIQPYSELLQQANIELDKLNLTNAQIILELREAKEKVEKLSLKLQDANQRLRSLVYRDGLTGVYNHRYFQRTLSSELDRGLRYNESTSLVLFDIDDFKQVNDTYGHPAGDLVLLNIARAVSSSVRTNDIVARFGGDEFAVILPATDSAGLRAFTEHLRRCVEGVETISDSKKIRVTISIGGVSVHPNRGEISKDLLIHSADQGLYLSKQNGRNQVTIMNLEA